LEEKNGKILNLCYNWRNKYLFGIVLDDILIDRNIGLEMRH